MQIYNLITNDQKFHIAASCTLEQLHYTLLYVLDLGYSIDYGFYDNENSWPETKAKNTTIAQLPREFVYRINNTDFNIRVTSANISDYLYPRSEKGDLASRLHQDFLLPAKILPSDLAAIKNKLESLIGLFSRTKTIFIDDAYFCYTIDNGAYCLDVFASIIDLKVSLDSKEEGIFKKSLSLVFIPDDDYFDISEFDLGSIYEIEDFARLGQIVKGVELLERDLPDWDIDTCDIKPDYHPLSKELATDRINPGKLQVTIEPGEDENAGAKMDMVYETIFDQQKLEFKGFESLCHQIQESVIDKLNQIGIVSQIEVNDLNLYNILLPLSRFGIEISLGDFSLSKNEANPFKNGNFDGAAAQELMGRLMSKYGYQGLTNKIMKNKDINMMDLMSLATRFKNQDIDPEDPKIKKLLTSLYETFKDDL